LFILVAMSGPLAGERIPVRDRMVMGRSPQCDREIKDPNISRRHVEFIVHGERLTLKDLGSSNGTFVGEAKVEGERDLGNGDEILLGVSRFRVEITSSEILRKKTLGSVGQTQFGFSDAEPEDAVAKSIAIQISPEALGQWGEAAELEKRLAAVLRMTEALGTLRTTKEIFDKILECLFEVFPQAQRGFLLLGKDPDALVPVAERGRRKIAKKVEISRSLVGRALAEASAVLFTGSVAASASGGGFDTGSSILHLKIRSAMVVPLVVKGEILGVLSLDTDNPGRAFSAENLAVAGAAAIQASVALKNALLNERIESDAVMKQNLCRFLPGPLAEQVVQGRLEIKLGGERGRASVFFSDIIGFTSLSETLEAEEVVAVLNSYFDIMVGIITDNHGSIDKFLGDAIMAFWGIPLAPEGHAAKNACRAALQMQTALWTFNYELMADGHAPLGHGIGINTGDVVAGNIGSSRRTEYTIIGDNVNLAQRLESRATRDQVLISESTFKETAGAAIAITGPPARVKGKKEPVQVLSLRGLAEDATRAILHLPMSCGRDAAQVSILACEIDSRGTSGGLELTILHPEGHDLTGQPFRLDLAGLEGIPDFQVRVLSTQAMVEGATNRRRYQKSRVQPIDWDFRIEKLLVDRDALVPTITLDDLQRH